MASWNELTNVLSSSAFWKSPWSTSVNPSSDVGQNPLVKPSGSGLLFVGNFWLLTKCLLVAGQLRLFISFQVSFGSLLGVCTFHLDYLTCGIHLVTVFAFHFCKVGSHIPSFVLDFNNLSFHFFILGQFIWRVVTLAANFWFYWLSLLFFYYWLMFHRITLVSLLRIDLGGKGRSREKIRLLI